MKNISFNFQKNTIEISATFAKTASIYGSDAYIELMNARRDFPTFTIKVVKNAAKKNQAFKGLDQNYMKKYITDKSGAESEQMETFKILCGETESDFAAKASFGEIKMWFLNTYPEVGNGRKKIDEILAKTREAKKAA